MNPLKRFLSSGDETTPPEREQCYIEGCTNRRRELGDKCDDCAQTMREEVDAKMDVHFGPATSAWEIRCFKCESAVIGSRRDARPPAICPECESTDVQLTQLGGDSHE